MYIIEYLVAILLVSAGVSLLGGNIIAVSRNVDFSDRYNPSRMMWLGVVIALTGVCLGIYTYYG